MIRSFPRITRQRSRFRITLTLATGLSLLLIPRTPVLLRGVAGSSQGQPNARTGQPRPGKPEGDFPNLEDVKRESELQREPLAPIPSTIRSRRNTGKPWDGRRVGDPFDQPPERGPNGAQHAHARKRPHPPLLLDDQFVQNFFTWALVRNPASSETTYWNDQLRVAYGQGQESLKMAAIEFGRTLFESAEYAARNRDNHWYVYDLYKTYLMRDPDSGGWSNWEATVATNGREYVRRGFEESTEFANLLAGMTPNGSASSAAASLISARVDPRNQPGNGMLTRDANWSVPLLSLPGRAGLDLGLALSYSSEVWTRSGPYIYFDEDNGFPSPGFRLGFPTVQRKTFDAQTARNAYLFITAAGKQVELRQVGSSNIYDAADSSYLRLTDNGSLVVQSTDGTKLSFTYFNGEYRCAEVKDRNGNYITVNYNSLGQITNITDTLGRVVTFNYDGNQNPITITQSWNGQTHQWVSFGWTSMTMQASFSGAAVVGTANNTSIPVISQVNLTEDGSTYLFNYTNSLQASAITRKSFDNVQRSQIAFTYDSPTNDAPRVTYSNVTAVNWTGTNGVPAQVQTHFEVAADGACQMTMQDGTVYKEYYGTGWQKGLTTTSEVWSGGVKQKWTTTAWTQDNTSVSYETNPRVTETNVYDAGGNRRRTIINYGSYAAYGLPYQILDYAADGVTPLRSRYIDYNLSSDYVNRRIIGLVSAIHDVDHTTASYVSKTTFDYDYGGEYMTSLAASATQHDVANYGTGFVTGRGNLSAVWHWDVTDIVNSSKAIPQTRSGYNVTGSQIFSRDALGHQTTVNYSDAFSDSVNRNTFAYPTTVTDADANNSYVQYNFEFGATTRTQSPTPAGQSQGAIKTMSYNNLGQLERITTTNNGAYTRYIYGSYYIQSFSSVNTVADEAYAIQTFDGIGRVIGAASNHPGSTGGYKAQLTIYDQMGRSIQTSNPTEINSGWTPVGDDATGWLYTQQTYDWKGRPLRTTLPDSTAQHPVYKEASYSGCGCAGGEVVTLTDEVNRQEKVYSDVLGRPWKTVAMSWPDAYQNRSEYATTVQVYNARDQVTNIKAYAGSAPADASSTNAGASCPNPSTTCQETFMNYDGFGRLQSKHVPEQILGTTIQYSTYSYNPDDTLYSSTDARGAVTTYSYNARHLVTGITSSLTGVSTINVTYGFDGAGNRTSMLHSVGGVQHDRASFVYDQLSRVISETRHINALESYSPNYGDFTISYNGYTLSNAVQNVTDPFGAPTNFTYDTAGRTATVTGTFSGTNYTYASNVSYRAWGAVKSASLGGATETITYSNRMLPAHFESSGMKYDYAYYDDGKLNQFKDLNDQIGDPHYVTFHYMSRAYSYDQAGRVSGVGQLPNYNVQAPFTGTYGYDAFDNLTSRSGQYALNSNQTDSGTYTNNRRNGWSYNAEGQVTSSTDNSDSGGSSTRSWTYDAQGALAVTSEVRNGQTTTLATGHDGDGKLIHEVINGSTGDYLIQSSVLGTVLTKLKVNGAKDITYVPANGLVFPMQMQDQQYSSPPSYMSWVYRDPLGIQESRNGYLSAYDPLGNSISNVQPPVGGPPGYTPVYGPPYGSLSSNSFINANNFAGGCYSAANNNPALCSDAAARFNEAHPLEYNENFWSNLPGSHDDLWAGENTYTTNVFIAFHHIDPLDELFAFAQEPSRRPSTTPDPQDTMPSDLEGRVKDIGSNCQEFLNRFFGALGSKVFSPDLGTLLKRIKTIELSQKPFDKHEGVADADGLAPGDGDNRQIYIKPIPSSEFKHDLANEHFQEFRWNAIAKAVVQELLHHARKSGHFDDRSLDQAAYRIMSPAEQAAAREQKKVGNYKVGTVGHGLVGSNCYVTNPYGPPPAR